LVSITVSVQLLCLDILLDACCSVRMPVVAFECLMIDSSGILMAIAAGARNKFKSLEGERVWLPSWFDFFLIQSDLCWPADRECLS
jgi:hypothetical protein